MIRELLNSWRALEYDFSWRKEFLVHCRFVALGASIFIFHVLDRFIMFFVFVGGGGSREIISILCLGCID